MKPKRSRKDRTCKRNNNTKSRTNRTCKRKTRNIRNRKLRNARNSKRKILIEVRTEELERLELEKLKLQKLKELYKLQSESNKLERKTRNKKNSKIIS